MSLPTSYFKVSDNGHLSEIDRMKSRGSSSSVSIGEELTSSSNNSETIADNQRQHHQQMRKGALKMERRLEENSKKSSTEVPRYLDDGNEIFHFIDPLPASPPTYSSCTPNKRIRFPLYDTVEGCSPRAVPPKYKPAVEALTVISMKSEWQSPYEPSPCKQWRNFIMQVNSTQLNFYHIDESLTAGIKHYSGGDSKLGSSHSHHSHFLSLKSRSTYQFNKADQERITFNIDKNREKYLSDDKIVKTYSLQCAKLGIPTDYTKKTFVLRMRCESEQFLLNFSHVDDMIMFTMYLQMGICVSLDLDLREYPSYRVVPRRRRRPRPKKRDGLFSSDSHGKSNSYSFRTSSGTSLSALEFSRTSNEEPSPTKARNTRSLSSGLLQIYNKSPSSSQRAETRTKSAPSSRKNSVAEDSSGSPGLKSRLRGLFKTRRSASNRKVTGEMFHSPARGLNSVLEDEEEDIAVARTKSLPHKNLPKYSPLLQNLRDRSINRQLPPGMNLMESHASAFTNTLGDPALPFTPEEEAFSPGAASIDSIPVQRYNTHTQRDLDEFQKIVREHREAEVLGSNSTEHLGCLSVPHEDEEDEDEDEDGDDYDENAGRDPAPTPGPEPASSVYADEGIFHDSDDDYVYTAERRNGYRNRASSTTSALSNTPYGSDEVKWNPPIKEMSRRRYIRDSLRCIKPLSENHRWIGKVVLRPTRAPPFETNNVPIIVGGPNFDSGRCTPTNDYFYGGVENKQIKNHYLKAFIAGPSGFLKAGTKMFSCGHHIRTDELVI
ncbi:hypothetical protein HG536_0D02760 [Torulaspora globosa]|uniref:PH domain-containing protein n=1 Tax=Torulaspora globosa TaxID=48254 RepID=A0A7G3ZGW8_9SACH|nr:uncharacterized protein HG536_0D02760 [Torulaspora globosa]QLL32754.1 hypothetical protein HG536_0D02760 [Torulaspora globosa]